MALPVINKLNSDGVSLLMLSQGKAVLTRVILDEENQGKRIPVSQQLPSIAYAALYSDKIFSSTSRASLSPVSGTPGEASTKLPVPRTSNRAMIHVPRHLTSLGKSG